MECSAWRRAVTKLATPVVLLLITSTIPGGHNQYDDHTHTDYEYSYPEGEDYDDNRQIS